MGAEPIAILVSGLARSFHEHLYPFLQQLPKNYHLYLSFARFDSADHFLNKDLRIDCLLSNSSIKLILVDSDIPTCISDTMSEREQNAYIHWYRLQTLFQHVPSHYTRVFRCRPDIHINSTPEMFMNDLSRVFEPNTIYIPKGFDSYDTTAVNDQVAYGSYTTMKYYCTLYSSLDHSSPPLGAKGPPFGAKGPLISEQALHTYLQHNNLQIVRTDLSYKLVLSQCVSIAICGDSGAGKSFLSKLIQDVLPFDQTLVFETDRYHKWERGAEQYKTMTHLHPEANHLEKLSTDAFKLCLGEDIYAVDYDHTTGRFTEPQHIHPNKFMVFCGLHTLYKESLNKIFNLKIYLDTDTHLKEQWKLQRDVSTRNADPTVLLDTMRKREPDYLTYIKPQEANADVILRLRSANSTTTHPLLVELIVKQPFADILSPKVLPFLQELPSKSSVYLDAVSYKCRDTIPKEEFAHHLLKQGYQMKSLKENYEGLIQYVIISLLWT